MKLEKKLGTLSGFMSLPSFRYRGAGARVGLPNTKGTTRPLVEAKMTMAQVLVKIFSVRMSTRKSRSAPGICTCHCMANFPKFGGETLSHRCLNSDIFTSGAKPGLVDLRGFAIDQVNTVQVRTATVTHQTSQLHLPN